LYAPTAPTWKAVLLYVFALSGVGQNIPLNETGEYAVRLQPFLTEIGAVVAPTGTVTVSTPKLAVCTVACVAPKNTWLLAGVGSKLAPVIVTVLPMKPVFGEKVFMIGALPLHWACTYVFRPNARHMNTSDKIFLMTEVYKIT
jgi:hypothetical protein